MIFRIAVNFDRSKRVRICVRTSKVINHRLCRAHPISTENVLKWNLLFLFVESFPSFRLHAHPFVMWSCGLCSIVYTLVLANLAFYFKFTVEKRETEEFCTTLPYNLYIKTRGKHSESKRSIIFFCRSHTNVTAYIIYVTWNVVELSEFHLEIFHAKFIVCCK